MRRKQDKLTKILVDFGNKWAKAGEQWDIDKGKRRKKALIKWVIKKVFYEY